MNERTYSAGVILVCLVVVLGLGFGYTMWSAGVVQGLHSSYDAVIEAHVTIPPATPSTPGTGYNTKVWTSDILSLDFGSVEAGAKSQLKSIKVTNIGLMDDTRLHVSTDLSTPGVHLIVGETADTFNVTRIDLKANGLTWQTPVGNGRSKTPAFRIEVDPGTAGIDINFHIILAYSYCND